MGCVPERLAGLGRGRLRGAFSVLLLRRAGGFFLEGGLRGDLVRARRGRAVPGQVGSGRFTVAGLDERDSTRGGGKVPAREAVGRVRCDRAEVLRLGRIGGEQLLGFEPDGGVASAWAATVVPDFMGAPGDFFVGG